MNELIVFTHNDADALGCVLNIEHKFPNVEKKYFYTNYANIDEIVDQIIEFKNQSNSQHIIIADVSFSDNKSSLAKLYDVFKSCTHIDHHMYPDGFWDDFPNMKVFWDKSRSATQICHDVFGNDVDQLTKLSKLIDVYDLWQEKHEMFNISQDLNEYFWHRVRVGNNPVSIESLAKEIVARDFKLPEDFIRTVRMIKEKYTAAIENYEERGLIKRAGEITICFIDDYFNQVLLKELAQGKNFVIGANSYGIIRIRVNRECPYTEEQLNKVRFDLTGNAEYGHLHAFTYRINGAASFEKLVEEVKKITQVIDKHCV